VQLIRIYVDEDRDLSRRVAVPLSAMHFNLPRHDTSRCGSSMERLLLVITDMLL